MTIVEYRMSTAHRDLVKRIDRKNTKRELADALACLHRVYVKHEARDPEVGDELERILQRVLF